ncbi:MAG: hypothetical protein U0790_26675 [Isosphaeraceae bacterium]
MSERKLELTRSLGRVARWCVLGTVLGFVGCGDGVERGSVQVPDRGSMKPGGGDAKGADQGKKAGPDTKVMTPGGK